MTRTAVPGAVRYNARPFLHGAEAAAVAEALEGGQYGHGEVTEAFERKVAAYLGVADVVAVESGTAALHLALLAAGIGPGSEVVVPSMTFCASVQAILACGARPRFAEVDPATLCVSAREVLKAVTPDTRAVMPVLYGGRAVDLADASGVLAERGIAVVEDAAQAFGSWQGDRRVGAGGEAVTCFSFGPIKSLTCGQGGAVIPRDPQEAAAVRSLRMLGITQPQAQRIRTTTYTVDRPGLRYPMSTLNAAIGLAQLDRFPEIEDRRQRLWRAYRDALAGVDGVVLVDVDVDRSVPFNCVVRVPDRDRVFAELQAQGIGVGVHYPPNHLQPAFAPWRRALPVTEQVAQEITSLPFHPAMTDQDAGAVAAALCEAVVR